VAPLAEVVSIDKSKLEDRAVRLLEQHLEIYAIPIDVEYLIEKQGVDICPFPNLTEIHSVRAALVCGHKQPTVWIDEKHLNEYPHFSRFTLAEELGHVILHRNLFQGCRTFEEFLNLYDALPAEQHKIIDRNARYFAGAVLAPQKYLAPDLDELIQRTNMRLISTVEEVLEWFAEALCDYYRMSNIALKNRITNAVFNPQIMAAKAKFLSSR
jgi:Zn-dependent peptidase ImmA (M78 family)